ncbi:MAG: very short patch repair endonuclease [Bacteroidales bacterium]
MTDVFSTTKRSDVMARIRGRGNRDTELALVALFRGYHITGWRRHQPLLGRPDFIFRKERLAVFVDGCFWHGCPRHCKMPAQNAEFWAAKLGRNRVRDRKVTSQLRARGWRVLRIWEHDLTAKPGHCIRKVRASLRSVT